MEQGTSDEPAPNHQDNISTVPAGDYQPRTSTLPVSECQQGTSDEPAPYQQENISTIPAGDYQPRTSTLPMSESRNGTSDEPAPYQQKNISNSPNTPRRELKKREIGGVERAGAWTHRLRQTLCVTLGIWPLDLEVRRRVAFYWIRKGDMEKVANLTRTGITTGLQVRKYLEEEGKTSGSVAKQVEERIRYFQELLNGWEWCTCSPLQDRRLTDTGICDRGREATPEHVVLECIKTLDDKMNLQIPLQASTVYHILSYVDQWSLLDAIADNVSKYERDMYLTAMKNRGQNRLVNLRQGYRTKSVVIMWVVSGAEYLIGRLPRWRGGECPPPLGLPLIWGLLDPECGVTPSGAGYWGRNIPGADQLVGLICLRANRPVSASSFHIGSTPDAKSDVLIGWLFAPTSPFHCEATHDIELPQTRKNK
uniref:Uncharacterized protein n=1 Tax=Timema shepardi TaxID=629360 RepID=A0A7R9G587_TIMSH|nr:unnamed protein product [Timema shepardi]